MSLTKDQRASRQCKLLEAAEREEALLYALVRIINQSSGGFRVSMDGPTVAAVPANLLRQARETVTRYRNSKHSTEALHDAIRRVW